MTTSLTGLARQLLDTRRAFDSVAADYDGPTGNNLIVQRMRARVRATLLATFPPGSRLLDLGCGTGLDAIWLAARGYEIVAIDWSPAMVRRARERVAAAGLGDRARAELIGIHELDRLGDDQFDGLYSSLGPLNCVPDLAATARDCARCLKPGGKLVAAVIGRCCPWEIAGYATRLRLREATRRMARGPVPVGLRGETVWTRYYWPREFARAFAPRFALSRYEALGLFRPPPYLVGLYRRLGPIGPLLGALDDRLGVLPLLRDAGDHFLMVLTRNDET